MNPLTDLPQILIGELLMIQIAKFGVLLMFVLFKINFKCQYSQSSEFSIYPPNPLFILQTFYLSSKPFIYPPNPLFILQTFYLSSKPFIYPPNPLFILQTLYLSSKPFINPPNSLFILKTLY